MLIRVIREFCFKQLGFSFPSTLVKRGRESQISLNKSIFRLIKTVDGEEFFELNKSESGAVLTSKNLQRGLDGSKDHFESKIFA